MAGRIERLVGVERTNGESSCKWVETGLPIRSVGGSSAGWRAALYSRVQSARSELEARGGSAHP